MKFFKVSKVLKSNIFCRPYLPANIDNSDDVEMGENNNKENIQNKLPAIAEDEEISFKSPTIMQKKPSNLVEKRRVLPLIMKRQQSVSRPWGPKEMQIYNEEKTAIITVKNEESLLSPTPQMTSVLKRIEDRKNGALSSVFFRSRRKGGGVNYFKLRNYWMNISHHLGMN